ncbi:hypothetical protein L195_g026628 [Trifolium pratense]|uniref:Uncharacterized protein n=1 Tax=Trifolium pratense TaxID=57577 RepID=A0A2K3NJV7_TRIPR|nr:hypothetical protein L195_g026628 [Trifolium pratense]
MSIASEWIIEAARSIAHGAIEQNWRVQASVSCAMAPLDCAWRNWKGILMSLLCILRHGATRAAHGAIKFEMEELLSGFCAMAQSKLEKEDLGSVSCAMAQRSCAWCKMDVWEKVLDLEAAPWS